MLAYSFYFTEIFKFGLNSKVFIHCFTPSAEADGKGVSFLRNFARGGCFSFLPIGRPDGTNTEIQIEKLFFVPWALDIGRKNFFVLRCQNINREKPYCSLPSTLLLHTSSTK